MKQRFALWPLLLGLTLASAACSMIVAPSDEGPRCKLTSGAPDPCGDGRECRAGRCQRPLQCAVDGEGLCPDGKTCQRGRCVNVGTDTTTDASCTPSAEVCGDRRDNDCDGKIDEEPDQGRADTCGDSIDNNCNGDIDEGHDADGDGNEWCGDTTVPGGSTMADCNDRDPKVFFGAPELCDGVDNDCNGEIDEATKDKPLCAEDEECLGRCVEKSCASGAIQCKADEMCNAATGECIPRGACQDSGCPGDKICDSLTGDCIDPKVNGSPCGTHAECQSGSCIESDALLLAGNINFVCGQTCCRQSNCGKGEVCFDPGNGARSCLPASFVEGVGAAPAPCSGDADCSGTQACGLVSGPALSTATFEPRSEYLVAGCRVPKGSESSPGENANYNAANCTAQAAVPIAVFGFFGATYLCTTVCERTTDCAGIGSASGQPARTYCSFEPVGGGSSTIPLCVVARNDLEVGKGGLGAACTSGVDCRDGGCVGSTEGQGFCAPACCNDGQCGSIDSLQTHCRPIAFGDHYENRCVP